MWRFAAEGGQLVVTPGGTPEGALTIQGLSALVYGTHDPGMFGIRGWGEITPALADRLRALFPAVLPYLHEEF